MENLNIIIKLILFLSMILILNQDYFLIVICDFEKKKKFLKHTQLKACFTTAGDSLEFFFLGCLRVVSCTVIDLGKCIMTVTKTYILLEKKAH